MISIRNWREWLFIVIALFVPVFFLFVIQLFIRRTKGRYLEKLESTDDQIKTDHTTSMDEVLIKKIGFNAFWALVYFGVGLLILYHLGRSNAVNQKEFYVWKMFPDCAALFITDDSMICSPFDRTTKEVKPSFTIINFNSSAITLSLEQVGPLHFKKEAIYPTPTSTPYVNPWTGETSTPFQNIDNRPVEIYPKP